MAKGKQREEAWARAKRLCRLDERQVRMAKELGMNPKKLPGLIPSKSQPYKLPVGVFIEQRHARSFARDRKQGTPPSSALQDRAVDIAVHLRNLADDLWELSEAGDVSDHDLREVTADLRRVASEIEKREPVGQLPYAAYAGPPGPPDSRPDAWEFTDEDDDIPF